MKKTPATIINSFADRLDALPVPKQAKEVEAAIKALTTLAIAIGYYHELLNAELIKHQR